MSQIDHTCPDAMPCEQCRIECLIWRDFVEGRLDDLFDDDGRLLDGGAVPAVGEIGPS